MFLKTKKIKNLAKLLSVLIIPFLMLFVFSFFQTKTQADELDDLIDEYCEGASEEECEEYKDTVDAEEKEFDSLENQLKNAEKLLKLKKEQSKTLQNQISLLNSEIGSVQGDINSLENEILNTEEKIKRLLDDIEKKNKNIKENQKNLSEMLRSYNKINKELGLTLISRDNSLGNLFSQSDYLSHLSTKINSTLKIIKEEREVLKGEREELEIEKGKLDIRKGELDDERNSLALKKNERNNILTRTKGEEVEYQKLIANIESQMKQLLIDVDSLSVAEQGELNDILKNADKPKEGKASESWHYYQIDSKWKNKSLGGTSLTIGGFGCAISSIAMVFTYHGEDVDPGDLGKRTSYFDPGGNIIWGAPAEKKEGYNMKLIKRTNHSDSNFNSSLIKDYIKKDLPVIVFIDGSGNTSGHYVVVHGYDSKRKDFVVHDPLWGPNLLLGTSKNLVEKVYEKYKRKAVVDQIIVYEED
jgi:peptidoglycan hydrolase CwlO-like protein